MVGVRRVSLVIAGLLGCAGGQDANTSTNGMVGEGSSSTTAATDDPRDDTTAVTSGAIETSAGVDASTTGDCVPHDVWRDDDGDGWGVADESMPACGDVAGWAPQSGDCDDGDAQVHPEADEPCGVPDRDCDFAAPPLCGSCLQVLEVGEPMGDGLYSIDPDGDGSLPPSQVWCDMTVDGGGWTLVQRTVWDPGQTSALSTGFASWRDVSVGNASPGSGYRLQGAAWPALNVQLEHMLRHVVRIAADGSSCDPLEYVGTDGTLSITDTDAWLTGLVASVGMVSDDQLSTLDSGPWAACVTDDAGAPWFYGGCCSTCPTFQGGYWPEPHPMFSYAAAPDMHGNTIAEVCTGDPIVSMGFTGVNTMEYYLR